MKKFKSLSTLLGLVLILASVCVSVSGQSAEERNKIASMASSGDGVRWDVGAASSAVTLTVSAPNGKVYTKQFRSGESPVFTLTDKKGFKLPDGQYTFELRLTPILSNDIKRELAESRNKSEDVIEEIEGRASKLLPATPLVQSGTFSVLRGMVIVAGAVEPGARQPNNAPVPNEVSKANKPFQPAVFSYQEGEVIPARLVASSAGRFTHMAFPDQVIQDDLIVQGSACIGIDCVNGESFGFDTIRLKENNTRIKFDDTSVSAGFPFTDWQLTANDSASGGANKFSIEDITNAKVPFTVLANAPTDSVFINASGRLGLRTATPVLDVHANTGNTPGIRLEQNSSAGFSAQTWDISGNEANFFIRDVTNGSRLPFRIRPGAPTSSIDINSAGKVGIGTASPNARVDIKQSEDSFVGGLHLRRASTNDTWSLVTGADNNFYIGYANNASAADAQSDFTVFPLTLTTNDRVGIGTSVPDQKLSVNGDASKAGGGSWQTFSDERLKNIRGKFNSGLNAVMQLQPIRYVYKRDNSLGLKSEGEHVGFGAQAVQKIIPEAVTANSQGYLLVNNDPIIWTMLNAIKEQQREIEQLKSQVRQLQNRAGVSNSSRPRRK